MGGEKATMIGQAGRGRRMGVILIAAGLLVLASAPAALGADRIYWGKAATTRSPTPTSTDRAAAASSTSPGRPRAAPGAWRSTLRRGGSTGPTRATTRSPTPTSTDRAAAASSTSPGRPPNKPHGLAIDPAAGRIYWANERRHDLLRQPRRIGRRPAQHSGATPDGPYGAAIDPAAGRIYWANRALAARSPTPTSTDRAAAASSTSPGRPPNGPHGVAIDPAGGRIYWANSPSDGTPRSRTPTSTDRAAAASSTSRGDPERRRRHGDRPRGGEDLLGQPRQRHDLLRQPRRIGRRRPAQHLRGDPERAPLPGPASGAERRRRAADRGRLERGLRAHLLAGRVGARPTRRLPLPRAAELRLPVESRWRRDRRRD